MNITEVKVKLAKDSGMVVAYATIVFEASLAIHDLRVIKSGPKLIVAMPDRIFRYACQKCNKKCPGNANFCPNCGIKLGEQDIHFVDIAHPITADCRKLIDKTVIDEYIKTVVRGRLLSAIHPSTEHVSQSTSEQSPSMHHP